MATQQEIDERGSTKVPRRPDKVAARGGPDTVAVRDLWPAQGMAVKALGPTHEAVWRGYFPEHFNGGRAELEETFEQTAARLGITMVEHKHIFMECAAAAQEAFFAEMEKA